jgi:hypothetical protein
MYSSDVCPEYMQLYSLHWQYWRVSHLNVLSCNRYDYHIVDDGSMGPEESEASRKRQVYIADPINKVALAPFLKEKLQTCAALHGEAAFNAAMSRLHPSLLLQLQQLMQP